MKTWTRHAKWLALALLAVGSQGCLDWWPEIGIPAGEKPWGELNPIQGMHTNPSFKDQEEGAMTYPPAETNPIDFGKDPGVNADGTVRPGMDNPVVISESTLRYGKLMYETNCIVCHGPEGSGDGYISAKWPAAFPNLYSDKVRQYDDAQIYAIISHGQGTMGSYKSQLKPLERWAVVNYVRALQRAQYPEPTDLARVSE